MSEPVVEPGALVTLHFSLALETGELIDSNFERAPASCRLGDGSLLRGFEDAILGLGAGDSIDTLLPPEHAFGLVNPRNKHHFPIAKFRDLLEDELLPTQVGSVVAFKDAAGFDLPGVVSAIGDSSIEVDFNHPLAGKAIWFKASIVAVVAPDVEAVNVRL